MDTNSFSISIKRYCPCDPKKSYQAGMWTRHTANCQKYKEFQEKRVAAAILKNQLAAEESERKAQAEAEKARQEQQEKERQARQEALDREESLSHKSGYQLRPVRLRRPPRLFPGMISSLLPPRRIPQSINTQPDCASSFQVPSEPPTHLDVVSTSTPKQIQTYRTTPNSFGLIHEYSCPLESLGQISAGLQEVDASLRAQVDCGYIDRIHQIIHPFPNLSTFRFAHWFYTGGSNDTQTAANRLLQGVICAPKFRPQDLEGVKMNVINDILDGIDQPGSINSPELKPSDGWQTTSVTITIPSGERLCSTNPTALPKCDELEPGYALQVPGLHHRSLVEVIRSRFSNSLRSKGFVYTPYKVFQTRPEAEEIRVRNELYTSDAWLEEHKRIQQIEIKDGNQGMACSLERAVVALMVWSDPTQVTDLGQTSVSPVYIYFGNQPKRERREPRSFAAEHVSFFPKLPSDIKALLWKLCGTKSARAPLLAHCRRELFHACWSALLNDDFIHAYHNGIVVECGDGILRRLFPRFMTYSADYIERQNAFSVKLHKDDAFSIHSILVPDILHEFELGVWKSVFTHLIRMLACEGADAIAEFNHRFRRVGNFGIDTIRKFPCEISELTGLTAHEYEDILQCCIPCFGGLFTHHDGDIHALIYVLTKWHFLAKLHTHTDTTLHALRLTTKLLGTQLRNFRDKITKAYTTFETPQEYAKRISRKSKIVNASPIPIVETLPDVPIAEPLDAQDKGSDIEDSASESDSDAQPNTRRLMKTFTLRGIKIHSLGDYDGDIKRFGTTDSYSTQIGEREHRSVKDAYKRTNFVDPIPQMTKLERRKFHLRKRANELKELEKEFMGGDIGFESVLLQSGNSVEEFDDQLHWGLSSDQYHTSERGTAIRVGDFLHKHGDDPATKGFFRSLQEHAIARTSGDITESVYNELVPLVRFPSGKLYQHAVIRINYTTYDIRRARDTINPSSSQRFLMVQNIGDKAQHSFSYAKLLGIFHVEAEIPSPIDHEQGDRVTERIDVLWVRWLGGIKWGGWAQNRLDLIGYVDDGNKSGSFGFIDPKTVVRGSYLIPAFELGRSKELLGQSMAWDDVDEGDWVAYYVIRFVDRDMGMRYFGGGLGHLDTRVCREAKECEFLDKEEQRADN